MRLSPFSVFFFFNDTATTEIYTLSLHDALPISVPPRYGGSRRSRAPPSRPSRSGWWPGSNQGPSSSDRKSTRLNSSHLVISYAVFCLKKKKTNAPTSTALPCGATQHISSHVRQS